MKLVKIKACFVASLLLFTTSAIAKDREAESVKQNSIENNQNYLVQNGYEVHLLTTNSENKAIHFPLDKRINHIEKQNVSGFFKLSKTFRNNFNRLQGKSNQEELLKCI